MSIVGSVIIIAGVFMYMTVRYITSRRPEVKRAGFYKMLGLTLIFYGCLKLAFGF
jgi:uncharacterized membrane-anchored protein